MSSTTFPYPIPGTPRVISPSPTPSETSERQDGYFAPQTRSGTKNKRQSTPQPEPIKEEGDGSSSDSSLNQRARTRSRSPLPTRDVVQMNGSALSNTSVNKRKSINGSTTKNPVLKSEPLPSGIVPPQVTGYLSPYARVQKSWREFSRSPSPLGLIPLHRHYRYLVHKHEVPRKLLHVSIGFMSIKLYKSGIQFHQVTPWLFGLLVPIASTDLLRHRFATVNSIYIKCLGAFMRETEVDGYNGVIWYLAGAYLSLRLYPKDVGTMAILLLSWCDTAASTFGRLYGKYTIRLRKGKSLAGSLAAFGTGILTALYFWGYLKPQVGLFPSDPPNAFMFHNRLSLPLPVKNLLGWKESEGQILGTTALVVMSVCSGLIASVSEFIDIWGWDDNLTIPLLSSFGLWAFLKVFG